MIIKIKVIPKAKQNLVKEIDKNKFKIYLTCAPEKGKANQALLKLLSGYFNVSKSSLCIIKGELSRNKIIEILN